MQDVEAVFSQRLRETREAAGLSQARLAEALSSRTGIDLDPTAITRIERGQRGVALREAHGLASTLGVSLAYLCRMPPPGRLDDLRTSLDIARREKLDAATNIAAQHARMSEAQRRVDDLEKRLEAETAATAEVGTPTPETTMRLREYKDVAVAAAAFDNDRVVILDLRDASADAARRAADFAAGLVRGGLRGSALRVDSRVLRLDPRGYGPVDTADISIEDGTLKRPDETDSGDKSAEQAD